MDRLKSTRLKSTKPFLSLHSTGVIGPAVPRNVSTLEDQPPSTTRKLTGGLTNHWPRPKIPPIPTLPGPKRFSTYLPIYLTIASPDVSDGDFSSNQPKKSSLVKAHSTGCLDLLQYRDLAQAIHNFWADPLQFLHSLCTDFAHFCTALFPWTDPWILVLQAGALQGILPSQIATFLSPSFLAKLGPLYI